MNGKELFEIWAPVDSIWSRWVSPVLFAQIECTADAIGGGPIALLPNWYEQKAGPENAVVVDLPGADSIRLALVLAERGYRPVLLINASPGPRRVAPDQLSEPVVVLDMSALVTETCRGTQLLRKLEVGPAAPPAFILDALRLKGTNPVKPGMFDNRWMVFPEDFPSARFLSQQGVKRVALVQAERAQPLEDLSHVLLRWQEGGIEILTTANGDTSQPSRIIVARPSRFRAAWYRALAILGLRRNSVGGFGSVIPDTSAPG